MDIDPVCMTFSIENVGTIEVKSEKTCKDYMSMILQSYKLLLNKRPKAKHTHPMLITTKKVERHSRITINYGLKRKIIEDFTCKKFFSSSIKAN